MNLLDAIAAALRGRGFGCEKRGGIILRFLSSRCLGAAAITLVSLVVSSTEVSASCMAPACHRLEISVTSCEEVGWLTRVRLGWRFGWEYFRSYRGFVVTGRLEGHSAAACRWNEASVHDWLTRMPASEPFKVFVRAENGLSCEALPPGSKLAGTVTAACCDGDPNSPCMLGFSLYMEAPEFVS